MPDTRSKVNGNGVPASTADETASSRWLSLEAENPEATPDEVMKFLGMMSNPEPEITANGDQPRRLV